MPTQSLATLRSLRLVVDANILVGELLRRRGRDRIADVRLNLFVTARAWNEMEHELPKRILAHARRRPHQTLTEQEIYESLHRLVAQYVTLVEEAEYIEQEYQARIRIPHDPDDWPTVALALALGVGIWSEDRHFLGYGLPTWRTDALVAYLAQLDADPVIRSDHG